jgi:hypothetical protein
MSLDNTPLLTLVGSDRRTAWTDSAGVAASAICAVHCAAMPLAMSYLPVIARSWLADASFHRWMAGGCFLLAVMAFGPGWKCHRQVGPALLGTIGIGLLAVGSLVVDGKCCSSCAALPIGQDSQPGAAMLATPVTHCDLNEFPTLTWMLTPLGGALLVVGHVANHRCRCTACQLRNV